MKDIMKLVISLGLVCAIGCAALVFVNGKTETARRDVKAKILSDNLLMVLPAGATCMFDETKTLCIDGIVFHRAYDSGKLAAVVAETSGRGFGGLIKALVGIDMSTETISRVVITEHSETPGLGTQATDRKEQKSLWKSSELAPGELPANSFLDGSFAGKSVVTSFRRVKEASPERPEEVQAVSGATYSSTGVLTAVQRACMTFKAHRDEIVK